MEPHRLWNLHFGSWAHTRPQRPPAVIILVGEIRHVAPLAEHLRPGHEIGRPVGHRDLRAVEEGEGQPALLDLVILSGGGGVGAVHVPAVPGGGGVAHRARERMDGDPPVQVKGGVPAEALVPVVLPGGVLRDLLVWEVIPRAPPAAVPALPLPGALSRSGSWRGGPAAPAGAEALCPCPSPGAADLSHPADLLAPGVMSSSVGGERCLRRPGRGRLCHLRALALGCPARQAPALGPAQRAHPAAAERGRQPGGLQGRGVPVDDMACEVQFGPLQLAWSQGCCRKRRFLCMTYETRVTACRRRCRGRSGSSRPQAGFG